MSTKLDSKKHSYEELEQKIARLERQVAFYKNIADSAQESIFILSPDCRIEYINSHATRELNLTEDKILGKKIQAIFPEEIAQKQCEFIQSVIQTGKGKQAISESSYNGQKVWLDTLIVPLKNEQGKIESIMGISRNITERKLAENEINEKENTYRTLIENANDGIYIRDKDGKIEFVNEKFLEIHGYTREEIIGTRVWDYLHPEDLEKIKASNSSLSEIGEGVRESSRVITQSGEIKYVDINTVPMIINGKEKAFGIVRDITSRVQIEERLKMLSEVTHEGIIIHQKGKIIDTNPAILEMLKIDREIAEKSSVFDFIRKDYHAVVKEKLSQNYMGSYEIVAVRKDQTEFTAELKVKTIEINNQTVRVVSINDISNRKVIESEIQKLSTAVKQSPVSIVITDLKGNIEYANPQFSRITGYTNDELIGQNPRILKTGHTSREEYKNLWATILQGKIWEGEFLNRRKDGTTYWENATISPIKDKDEKIINFLAIKEDITERKKDREMLLETTQNLKKANATKDMFFSILAHDLRSPMGNIMQFTSLLDLNFDTFDDEDKRSYIRLVKDLSEKTFDLLENLLAWSRVQLNKMDFTPEKVNLKDIAEETLDIFEENLKNKNIHFINNINTSTYVFANEESIKLVFRNLLSNAIKFTPQKGKIEITAQRIKNPDTGRSHYKICFKDTGVGIPKDKISKIFDADRNFSTKGTNNEKGTGLGLILCKEFIEKNNGKISVSSTLGKGSQFCFTLPLG
ncbi:MAG: PAS domain S-box protein [Bacteroidales bacterium]|nr:PAS domain S-box protein [Bacteroidales bacterium]